MNINLINNTAIDHRNSYHTNIKILTQFNLLPEETKKLIPKSNISRWKNSDFSDVFGVELYQEHINTIKELMKHKKFIKSCLALLRIKNALIDVFKKNKNKNKKIKDLNLKEVVVNTIDRVKETICLGKVVRYFKITIYQYYVWAKQIKTKCLETIIEKCPRLYPNQITKKEINKMSELLQDNQYQGWPIYSIAWHAIKNNLLFVSVNTWYKYSKLLGLFKPLPENRRKNHKTGIRADKPLEKIHADVTIFRPIDNTKVYIYIIMDNFSRYILNWKVSLKLSAEIFVQNLKEAYYKHFITLTKDKPIELIVDGGPENNNEKVDKFIYNDIDNAIKKLVAQRDIIFSNSMVEAVNKILKYRFLFQHNIPDYESTVKHLNNFIPIYNQRPHSALGGRAPEEVLKGVELNKKEYTMHFKEAQIKRIEENRIVWCKNCED